MMVLPGVVPLGRECGQDIIPLPCTTFDGTTESGAVSTTRPSPPDSNSRRETHALVFLRTKACYKSQANRCWVRTCSWFVKILCDNS